MFQVLLYETDEAGIPRKLKYIAFTSSKLTKKEHKDGPKMDKFLPTAGILVN